MDFNVILANPAFWLTVLKTADSETQAAAPDYTIGHKVAAIVGHLLGVTPISTPDAAHARSLASAIGDGLEAVVLQGLSTPGAFTPTPPAVPVVGAVAPVPVVKR